MPATDHEGRRWRTNQVLLGDIHHKTDKTNAASQMVSTPNNAMGFHPSFAKLESDDRTPSAAMAQIKHQRDAPPKNVATSAGM